MPRTIHDDDYQKLLDWLKKARLEKGWSMRRLGQELDMPHSYIGKIESAERRLDVKEFVEYCRALGVSEEEGLYILSKARKKS